MTENCFSLYIENDSLKPPFTTPTGFPTDIHSLPLWAYWPCPEDYSHSHFGTQAHCPWSCHPHACCEAELLGQSSARHHTRLAVWAYPGTKPAISDTDLPKACTFGLSSSAVPCFQRQFQACNKQVLIELHAEYKAKPAHEISAKKWYSQSGAAVVLAMGLNSSNNIPL